MVIGRGRRREHPQPTLCTTTTKKKVREKSTKKKYGKKNTRGEFGKKLREKYTGGGVSTEKKSHDCR
jgi:hypothetical protein